ncbi:flagellar protein FliT [Thermomicrobium sp. 4228-Ro]|uniref:flagellar protein FliT n=1 Tax=Thermomicrobium sp. 4228-Ro TaxID=2993937 RepID=UPI0022487EFD|nr:flagellar protein FliT [Thermomicrobium sp. 4228-Ro]MCX2728221.1 flagellar protein FliT [Thermomicrobium sp. 4228-Ro]
MEGADALDLATRLRDLTLAQLEAARASQWETATEYLRQRDMVLQRLQAIDPERLDERCRAAIAALLDEVRALDRELVTLVETALEAVREEQRAIERNDAAARGYRRALGASGVAEIVDREV